MNDEIDFYITKTKYNNLANECAILITTFFDRNVVFSSEEGQAQISVKILNKKISVLCRETLTGRDTLSRNISIEEEVDYRNLLKREMFSIFLEITGRRPLWGILQGIRPTKLVYKSAKNLGADLYHDSEVVMRHMEEEYLVSKDKARLLLQIAQKEASHVFSFNPKVKNFSVYVGIPFCPSRCTYCSFTSNLLKQWESRMDDYLDALIYEIKEFFDALKESPVPRKISSLYIGGGTPTSLSAAQMDRLLEAIDRSISFDGISEITVEAGRPDTITKEKLEVLKHRNVDRISINPQTMNQKTLALIGRNHSVDQTREAMKLAKEIGFKRINMDLILGLPGEDDQMVMHTLDEVIAMEPSDVTVHTLAIKRHSDIREFRDEYEFLHIDEMHKIMEATTNRLMREGNYEPYYLYRQKNMIGQLENIGYCKGNDIGKYNIEIMEECIDILAFGAGSSTKILCENGVTRVENLKNVKDYIERVDEMVERKKAAYM